jgi:short-subunit dehydrogenase
MEFSGKNILVVGASGVLGGEFLNQLSAAGANVYATGRNHATASGIPAVSALNLIVDLADPQSISVLTSYLNANVQLDGIVLAAGRVGFGAAAETSAADLATLTQINFMGQAQLVSELLPNLLKGREPFVASVTGVVAEKTFIGMSAYSASKSALAAWLAGLQAETKRHGLLVLDARPGHTETGLATRPLFGAAPAMPQGMTAQHVVSVICAGISDQTRLLTSADF